MISQTLEVIEIHANTMILQPSGSSCHSCSANKSCGTGILAGVFKPQRIERAITPEMQLEMQSGTQPVQVGDLITVEMATKTLLFHAFMGYIFPILALFAGSALAMVWFPEREGVQIGFGVLGFVGALLTCRIWLK